ncbi:MAG TPA: DUF4349 domain-containing protein [Mycobacteriales bacterium]|nr:DUF4349 domain-containing protein [Mycobacteriales bacterium]
MHTDVRTIAPALVLLAALAGCSGGTDDSAATSARYAGDTDAGSDSSSGKAVEQEASAPLDGARAAGTTLTRGRPAATDRAIAYVGELRVEVEVVTEATASAITQVAGVGGTLANQESVLGDSAMSSLTFKVPPAQFSRLLTSLGRLGKPVGQTVTSEDVTEQLVDLEARLRTAKASADRVRALLSRAGSITEIVTLEREVAAREAEVESMQARLRSLDGRVEEATLTLLLTADGDSLAEPDDDRGFFAGLRGGWDAFTKSASVVATVAGAVLPFLVALAVPAAVAVAVRRRRHPGEPATTAVS